MDEPYKYEDLTNPKTQIRLVKIQAAKDDIVSCELEVFAQKDLPAYRALSYCWGPEQPVRDILVNGKRFAVRKNLWDFLHMVALGAQPYADKWLWIDQICIQQASTSEKSDQITLMGRIFFDAEEVFGWLGLSADNSDLAMQSINILGERLRILRNSNGSDLVEKVCSAIDEVLTTDVHMALCRMFSRPYWSRLWVVQEIYLAKDLTWLCGGSALKERSRIEVFRYSIDFRDPSRDALSYGQRLKQCLIGSVFRLRGDGFTTLLRMTKDNVRYNLVLHATRLHCADPRDYVYGLLALGLQDTSSIRPDYTQKPADVFWDFFSHFYARFDLRYLYILARLMSVSGNEAACQPGRGSIALARFKRMFPGATPQHVFSEAWEEENRRPGGLLYGFDDNSAWDQENFGRWPNQPTSPISIMDFSDEMEFPDVDIELDEAI